VSIEDDDADYVTFDLAGERYAFPMSRVREIIRMPAVVKVPLRPPSVAGLANLRGRVLPVVSLRACCGMEPAEHDETTRVIVIDGGAPLGFVVDRVAGVIGVDPADLESADAVRSAVRSGVLVGVIKSAGGGMTSVLDVDRLVGGQFDRLGARVAGPETGARPFVPPDSEEDGEPDRESDDTIELVSFVVEGQEYALPIDQVREIVQAPESISHIPNADGRVLGMIDVRGRLLPVVSMRRVLGLPVTDVGPGNRIVVCSLDGGEVGAVMDAVREVLRVPHELVAPVPALMAVEEGEVESVCRLEDGKRLVSVLSARRMFDSPEVRNEIAEHQGAEENREMTEDQRIADDGRGDEEMFVVFRLDEEEYAVDVDAVQEIIRVPGVLIRVPKSYDFVAGLVNLRGTVLPVIDLRTRLGLPERERDERQRIVVLIIGGVRTGVIVDSVAEVARVGRHVPEPAPELSAERARVVTRVANLPGRPRMLLLVQVDRLLAADQARALEEVVAEDALAAV